MYSKKLQVLEEHSKESAHRLPQVVLNGDQRVGLYQCILALPLAWPGGLFIWVDRDVSIGLHLSHNHAHNGWYYIIG